MLEKNNFEILLNKGCGKDQDRYRIRSAKVFSGISLFKAVGSYSASRENEQINATKYNASPSSRLFILFDSFQDYL